MRTITTTASRDRPATFAQEFDQFQVEAKDFADDTASFAAQLTSAVNLATTAGGVGLWAAGTWPTGTQKRSTLDGLVYIRLAPGGASSTDPKLDPTGWRLQAMQLPATQVITTATHTIAAYTAIEMSFAGQQTVLFPAAPALDEWFYLGHQNSRLDNILDPQGLKIQGATGQRYAWRRMGALWRYVSVAHGWRPY